MTWKEVTAFGMLIGFLTVMVMSSYEEQNTTEKGDIIEQYVEDTNPHDWDVSDTQGVHDWGCRYIIVECMTVEGKDTRHYVDDYTRNVDHSITFVGEDGLLTTVPYPYFQIIVNKKFGKEDKDETKN